MLLIKNIAVLLRYLTHLWWEDVMAYVFDDHRAIFAGFTLRSSISRLRTTTWNSKLSYDSKLLYNRPLVFWLGNGAGHIVMGCIHVIYAANHLNRHAATERHGKNFKRPGWPWFWRPVWPCPFHLEMILRHIDPLGLYFCYIWRKSVELARSHGAETTIIRTNRVTFNFDLLTRNCRYRAYFIRWMSGVSFVKIWW